MKIPKNHKDLYNLKIIKNSKNLENLQKFIPKKSYNIKTKIKVLGGGGGGGVTH